MYRDEKSDAERVAVLIMTNGVPMRGLKNLTLVTMIALSLPVLALPADGSDPVKYNLKIDKQSLSTALQEFATQSGVQIIFFAKVTDGHEAPSLKGKFTAADAVARLLDHSNLTFQQLNAKTIQVEPKAATNDLKKTVGSSFTGPETNLQLAQVDQKTIRSDSSSTQSSSTADNQQGPKDEKDRSLESKDSKETQIQEVVVTGTHIRGEIQTSKVITIDSAEIERSGYQTTNDVLRALPQNFTGGLNATTVGAGGTQNLPSPTGVATVNLRGLGSESTLTLVDGQRLASSESGSAVDISLIPLAAIDRVEVMTDGASAIYGSDAVAGVVNFILRKNFDGIEVGGAWGDSSDGGGFLQRYESLAGTHWQGGSVLVSYEYVHQTAVDTEQRDFISKTIDGTTLLPETKRNSVFLSGNQSISDGVDLFAEGLYTKRYSNSASNQSPFLPGLFATTDSESDQYGLALGTHFRLSDSWRSVVAADFAGVTASAPQITLLNGGPFELGGTSYQNRLRSIEVDADGTAVNLPSGPARLAFGAGYRQEDTESTALFEPASPEIGNRAIGYAFGELLIPLVADSSNRVGLHSLTASVAGRYEHYSDFGDTSNPKVSLLYIPTDALHVRASWGTSFHAPDLQLEHSVPLAIVQSTQDPLSPTGSSIMLLRYGGNSSIQPEKSSIYTLDVDLRPTVLPGLDLQLTGYQINYRDRIAIPTSNTVTPLTDPFAQPFITRNPSESAVAAILAGSQVYNEVGPGFDPASIAAIVDDRNQNFSRQTVSGADFIANYNQDTSVGIFGYSANIAYLNMRQRYTALSPVQQLSGTVFNPPRVRSRIGVTWEKFGLNAAAFMNYVGSSEDPDQTPIQEIASWATVDFHLGYAFNVQPTGRGTRLSLTVQNLTDRRPPFVNAAQSGLPGINFDSTNASALGRFIGVELTHRW
jgi:iron complex outermembrane receptor protein